MKTAEEIAIRKQIKSTFKEMRKGGNFEIITLKKSIPIKTGTSFIHNSDSGRWTMTALHDNTEIIGVNPLLNTVVFNNKLTKTVRGKCDPDLYESYEVALATLSLSMLEAIAEEVLITF